jgi:hypothetical protein
MTALQQHSQVHIDGLEPVDHGRAGANVTVALAHANQFFANATRLGKTGGFKIRPRNLLRDPGAWVRLMRKYNTRIIWNHRSNVLKASLGHYPIAQLGSTAAYEGIVIGQNDTKAKAKDRAVTRFRVTNMGVLSRLMRDRLLGEAEVGLALRRLGSAGRKRPKDECTLPVSYEALLSDAPATVLRVQQFLGLNMNESHAPLRRKATSDNLCELVENWDDVCTMFYGCTFVRWMLEDIPNGCTCNRIVTTDTYAARKYCPDALRRLKLA